MKKYRTFATCAGLLTAAILGAATPVDLAKIGMNQPLDPALRPALADVPDRAGLPRVLLIGDSISIGYTLPVRARLAGRANVHRPGENAGPTVLGIERLDAWLGAGPWAVIHFNFGLHDLKYLDEQGNYVSPARSRPVATPEQYANNLRVIVARLRRTGARLIFATTTPVPAGTLGRLEGGEQAYNAVALQVMRENGVAVDDLGAYARAHQKEIQLAHNVHYTSAGYEALADLVAASIGKSLNP
ncbi:SGNH/GDSL hydrolase family protein [Opitutus sp. GAS368]|uniref:SGNH/GDSL hydrolase family protein n=1 Tax=Opitutus sp. GAS368 TaxID=1882749 RepID=UPI0012FE5CB3|nr:SGNH/GDSL hydrolase family protein [Opitutus sp. GAS368]